MQVWLDVAQAAQNNVSCRLPWSTASLKLHLLKAASWLREIELYDLQQAHNLMML